MGAQASGPVCCTSPCDDQGANASGQVDTPIREESIGLPASANPKALDDPATLQRGDQAVKPEASVVAAPSPQKPPSPAPAAGRPPAHSDFSMAPVTVQDAKTWQVKLSIGQGEKLGMQVQTHQYEKPYLTVGAFKAGGPVDRWNQANADKLVEDGDLITEVNGCKASAAGSMAMTQELQKANGTLVLGIERQAQRHWDAAVYREWREKMGMQVELVGGEGGKVTIVKLTDGLALARHNAKNPDRACLVGDKVLAINGVSEVHHPLKGPLIEELAKPDSEVILSMKRSIPR